MPFVTARRLVAGVVIACVVLVGAPRAEPSASAAEDIQCLLDAIDRSGCEFYRNGSWHVAADARSHLASKYRAVNKKRPVPSVQHFIDWVGSRSSMTGQEYRVRCPGVDAVTSAEWFRRELERRPLSAGEVKR